MIQSDKKRTKLEPREAKKKNTFCCTFCYVVAWIIIIMIFLGSCLYIYIGDRHGYGEETYYLGKFGNSINITREIECSRKYVYRNFKCSLKEHYFSDGKESHIYYDGCDKVDFLNDEKNVHDSQQRQCFKICKAFSSKGDLRIHPGFGLNDRISVTKICELVIGLISSRGCQQSYFKTRKK